MGMANAMRRSLLSLATSTSTSPSSTRSAMLFRPFMSTLQYRAFRNHPGVQSPYLLFGNGNKYSKFSQLKFTKGRVTSAITTNFPKATRDIFHFRCLSDGSKGTLSIHSHLEPRNSFSYVPFDIGIRFPSRNCAAFSKRYLSQVPRVTDGNERTGVSGGRRDEWFNEFIRKQNNAVDALCKNSTTNSSISASKDVNRVTSTSEELVRDGVEGAKLESSASNSSVSNTKQNSKVAGKQKQQSGVSDGRRGGKWWFYKYLKKQNNAVDARYKNNTTISSISASEDVNAATTTSEELVRDGVEGAKLESSTSNSSVSYTKQNSEVAGKQKQQSRSKKNMEQLSATVA